jgi:hypothetical protein
MGHLRESTMREARDPAFALLLAGIAVSLIKAVDQPGATLILGGASVRIVVGDVLLAALTVAVGLRIARSRCVPRQSAALAIVAAAFGALILATALANGGTAFVAAGKLLVLAALLLGCLVLIDSTERLWAVTLVIVAVTATAVAWGLVGFLERPGSRQASFVGEHDLAALATACLVLGLAALHVRHRLGRLPLAAGIVGCLGIVLGAALASLLGLYLASAAMILIAALRGALRLRAVAATLAVAVALTGAVYTIRANELGFLKEWFAPVENAQPGQYAGSWSQRLIFAYVGGRIFLDKPLLGTGWWGELPPREYARYLPAARRRFPDQPPNYFPPAGGVFIPQQTFDQVAFELGIVGVTLLLSVLVIAVRDSLRSARRWPQHEPDELAAYLAGPWLAALVGALAGSAIFGGTPMGALFWLTLGLVGALSGLAAARARATAAAHA